MTGARTELPGAIDAVVATGLAKRADDRYASCGELIAQAGHAVAVAEPAPPMAGSGLERPSATLDSPAAEVFVGRERELAELRSVVEAAFAGHGRLALVVGQPGIGKTRTALEVVAYARQRHARVLWGRCYEGGGAPPYWPWVQAIRAHVGDGDTEQLRSELGAGGAEIAEVVPEIRERIGDLVRPPTVDDPRQARFRLFDSITGFLRRAARSQPLVVVLEDLHWADTDSLALLEFLARELAESRLLILGNYRDVEVTRHHPLSATLAELSREHLAERIVLGGLSEREVAHFVEAISGIPPPAELVEAVHTQTEGNPLFVTEILRAAGAGGRADTPSGMPTIQHPSGSTRGRVAGGDRQAARPSVRGLQPHVEPCCGDRQGVLLWRA